MSVRIHTGISRLKCPLLMLELAIPSFGLKIPSFGSEIPSFGLKIPSFGLETLSFGLETLSFGLKIPFVSAEKRRCILATKTIDSRV